ERHIAPAARRAAANTRRSFRAPRIPGRLALSRQREALSWRRAGARGAGRLHRGALPAWSRRRSQARNGPPAVRLSFFPPCAASRCRLLGPMTNLSKGSRMAGHDRSDPRRDHLMKPNVSSLSPLFRLSALAALPLLLGATGSCSSGGVVPIGQ